MELRAADASTRVTSPAHERPFARLACPGLLAAAVVVFVAAVFGLGSDNAVAASPDFRDIGRHLWAYLRHAVYEGRLPLWNPHTFSGWPFAADLSSHTFDPAALLGLLLPLPTAAITRLTLHLVLAAIGTYLLLRGAFALGRGPAMLGGLVYALSGSMVGQTYAGHHSYLAATYLPLLLLCVDAAAARLRRGASARGYLAAGGILLAGQLLSGGMQYVWLGVLFIGGYRAAERLWCGPRDVRACGYEAAVLGAVVAIGIGLAAIQLFPSFELARLSTRAHVNYAYAAVGSYPPRFLPSLGFGPLSARGVLSMWEYYGYVGAAPFLLGLVAITRVRRERRLIPLLAVGVLAGLFMLGSNGFLFPILWRHAPTVPLFRVPARAIVLVDLVLAIMAAIGLDVIVRRLSRHAGGRVAALLVALVLVGQVLDVAWYARANRRHLARRPLGTADERLYARLSDVLQNDRSWYRYWFHAGYFPENDAYAFGARSLTGYDNLYLERYRRFIHHMTDTPIDPRHVNLLPTQTFDQASTPFPFKILGVKYATFRGALVTNPQPVQRGWFVSRARRVGDEAQALAYLRSDAFEPDREVVFETPEADRLGLPAGGAAGPGAGYPAPVASVTERSPEHLRIEIGPHPDGYVVLSEIFYPGWRARIDGREIPIYRADSILRTIALGAGPATVIDMTFEPASLRYGALVSAGTVALLLILLRP